MSARPEDKQSYLDNLVNGPYGCLVGWFDVQRFKCRIGRFIGIQDGLDGKVGLLDGCQVDCVSNKSV